MLHLVKRIALAYDQQGSNQPLTRSDSIPFSLYSTVARANAQGNRSNATNKAYVQHRGFLENFVPLRIPGEFLGAIIDDIMII